MPEIVTRTADAAAVDRLVAGGIDRRLARLYAARGVRQASEVAIGLPGLIPPSTLTHAADAARLLADAIAAQRRLLIVADYDADGATACAVGVRALRAMGARVDYIVPDRFKFGYGLTPEIVRLAAERTPDLLITVDNGIAAVDGVAEANQLGMAVLVTDHHLPGDQRPDAACIVNPNQAGCEFASKALAGVGVIFYVMLALRAELRARGAFATRQEPNLAELLDIVALGTVADVVRLDANNRILVAQGLERIRAGRACPGINALLEVAGREARRASVSDLGFAVGPRINAAGRLEDMTVGIECLLADDPERAATLATRLDQLNRERREIEATMQESALQMLEGLDAGDDWSLTVHHPAWHPGVVGLLASRLKDRLHRPVFAFAAEPDGRLKGSGRSISGLHLRDAIDLVAKRHPEMIERFGGHAAAAGLTLRAGQLEPFSQAFEAVARQWLDAAALDRRIETDGGLAEDEITFELAQALRGVVWGQGFPEPRFTGRFPVLGSRVVGDKHARLTLGAGSRRLAAIRFGEAGPFPPTIDAVYRLDVNEYQGSATLQLVVEHWARAE